MLEQVVYDSVESCPYLDGEEMRTPLRYQIINPTPSEFDTSLSDGNRRVGRMFYKTECPSCNACEPIRVPVQQFHPSKSQRRVLRKNEDITMRMDVAHCTAEKLALYNKHKLQRNLAKNEAKMGTTGYNHWFSNTCVDSREFQYFLGDQLIGVSILDFGLQDISSVYFFFDPDFEERSLGTFSALFEIDWMKQQGMRHYYLGLYVAKCSRLNYKARFIPHQRLIAGEWLSFEQP